MLASVLLGPVWLLYHLPQRWEVRVGEHLSHVAPRSRMPPIPCLIYLFLAVLGLRCCASFSLVVAHGLSCSVACGIFPGQGSNLCLLHWQADSLPLSYWGSPRTPKGANNPYPCWTAGGLRVDEGRRLAHGCTSSQGVSSAEPGSEPPAASRR